MALDPTPHFTEIDGDQLLGQIDELSRQTNLMALDAMLATMSDDAVPNVEAAHRARVLADRLASGTRKTEARSRVR